MELVKKIKEMDFVLIAATLVIAGVGLVSLFSFNAEVATRQAFFIAGGVLLMFVFSLVDWRAFRENSYIILLLYLLSLFSLYGLLWFGPTIRGVNRWYRVGDFLFDPAEVFKIVIIILLAKFFSKRHVEMYRVSHIIMSGLYVALPAYLIFRQPDLGSALVLMVMWMGVLIVSGIKIKHFLAIVGIGLITLAVGWFFFLADYQKDRAISFVNPELDPQGIGWGQTQAKIAVGSGGLLGKGFGSGTQTQHGFLPEPETDFIFAAIAEEFGFVGVFVLIGGWLVFFWRIILIILYSKSNFPRLFAVGFSFLILTQVFINIGMNLGILPIIGTPLPLVSYGGSNLLFVFVSLGVLQSIRKDIRRY